jgi:hypothetical protein
VIRHVTVGCGVLRSGRVGYGVGGALKRVPHYFKAKKTDDLESYVYRCDDYTIGVPGEYFRQSIINAAKFRQDPRSPRKSAMDLYKAGIVSLTELSSLGKSTWDKGFQTYVWAFLSY